jgi:hypothetical protein
MQNEMFPKRQDMLTPGATVKTRQFVYIQGRQALLPSPSSNPDHCHDLPQAQPMLVICI